MSFTVEHLWEAFGQIPVDDDGITQEQFLHFPPGMSQVAVWAWFEETLGISVYKLLYPSSQEKPARQLFTANIEIGLRYWAMQELTPENQAQFQERIRRILWKRQEYLEKCIETQIEVIGII